MYYRRFVQNFATIVAPLNELLRKDRDVNEWDQEHEKAFRILKKALSTSPVLATPKWDKPFKLYTDACGTGLSAVLAQNNDDNHKRVICYASREIRGAEQNYESTKLECLGVVWAVK